MKKLLAILSTFLLLPAIAGAFTVPERSTGFLQDYANMLAPEQVSALETKLENYEKSSTNEIAVVTIPSLDGDTIENVAQEIFTKWGIGKKGKDNGVLLLIALQDRRTRIHTGYGVEDRLTDIGTSYIQSDIVRPAFKAGDYYGGINGAVNKMIEALSGNGIVLQDQSDDQLSYPEAWSIIFFISIFIFQFLVSLLAQSKSWWGGGVVGGLIGWVIWHFFIVSFISGGLLLFLLIILGLVFDYVVSAAYSKADFHRKRYGVYPWWWGGGGFGGGSGGGFGGFGGGGSGGGGSSGSW